MSEFLIFWIASVFGAAAILPYQFGLMKEKIEEDRRNNPNKKIPPNSVLMLINILQTSILLGVASYFGTKLAPKVDLHWWLLDNWLNGNDVPYFIPLVISIAIVLGFAASLFIVLLDMYFSKKMPKVEVNFPSRKQSLLASFYGGISEEVLTRLFVMTLIVYLASLLGLEDAAYWIGIVFAAVLFGVLHLPAAIQLFGKSGIVIFRTILLNAVPGIIFGVLYWYYGIEIAMIAHFTGDIGLHVVFGPFFRNRANR